MEEPCSESFHLGAATMPNFRNNMHTSIKREEVICERTLEKLK